MRVKPKKFTVIEIDEARLELEIPAGDPSFKKKVLDAINCEHFVLNSNLMIIDWVEIYPEYRGRNFANLAMETMIRKFGRGMELVALCAMPLQFIESRELDEHSTDEDVEWFKNHERLKPNELSSDMKKSTEKLASHYGAIGFWRVTGTDYMVKAN